MNIYCDKLKKKAMDENFGINHKTFNKTIKYLDEYNNCFNLFFFITLLLYVYSFIFC